jgi:hypothetical protein
MVSGRVMSPSPASTLVTCGSRWNAVCGCSVMEGRTWPLYLTALAVAPPNSADTRSASATWRLPRVVAALLLRPMTWCGAARAAGVCEYVQCARRSARARVWP